MQELLDRIKERNFGKSIELRAYSGNNSADLQLLSAGVGAYSLYVDNQDVNITLYDFNSNRNQEIANELEIDNIITKIIRKRGE